MEYRLGIRMKDEIPYVVMEELDDEGKPTGKVTLDESMAVEGTLHSNEENQLLLTVEGENEPDVTPKKSHR